MMMVCVPIPEKENMKSAEHVSNVDADYKPPRLPFCYRQWGISCDEFCTFVIIEVMSRCEIAVRGLSCVGFGVGRGM